MKKILLFLVVLYLINGIKAQTCGAYFNHTKSGLNVQFLDSSWVNSGNPSFSWNFGDGSSSTLTNPNHSYNSAGTYVACLTLSTSTGCQDVFCDTITLVNNFCLANFTYSSNANNVASFTNLTTPSSGFNYLWDFGDGDTSTLTNPIHTYTNSGIYVVTLSANILGTVICSTYDTVFVNYCNANFVYNSFPSGLVNFIGVASSSRSSSYSWNFGDGSPSSFQKNPSHQYNNSGLYFVSFSIFDSLSNTNCSFFDSIPINITAPCTSGYIYSINQNTVSFQNTAPNFTGIYYDFGDGSFSNQPNPIHTYLQNGTYQVCQTVSDSLNLCLSTFCDTIIVNVPPCQASFTYSLNQGQLSITNSAQNYTSIFYDFGDGNSTSNANPVHTYLQSGNYSLCQIVSKGSFCSDTLCVQISVNIPQPCQASFTFSTNEDSLFITNNSVNADTIYYDFGDGSNSYSANPIHVYAQSGSYQICQIIFNSFGCSDTLCATIQIQIPTPCKAGFTANVVSDSVLFSNQATSYTSLQYDFGDGNFSSDPNPVHYYAISGTYVVSQQVMNAARNCTDTYYDTLTVNISTSCYSKFLVAIDTNKRGTLYLVNTSSKVNSHQYQWSFGDGGTAQGRTPTHLYQNYGRYEICLSITDQTMNCVSNFCDTLGLDSNGNLLKSSGFILRVIDGSFIGIPEFGEKSKIEVYPNPFTNSLTINKPDQFSSLQYELMNSIGQKVKSGVLQDNVIEVDNLKAGIYFIRFYQGEFQQVTKILKQ